MRVDQKTPEPMLRGLFLERTLANLSDGEKSHLNRLLSRVGYKQRQSRILHPLLDRFGLKKTIVSISPSIDNLYLAIVDVVIDKEIVPQ
jgi:hypothetical protein